MRAEGVDVPDPDGSGNFGSIPTGPSVDEALKTCQQILQGTNGGGAQITPEIKKQFLDLAKCIRANGFPDFPDPGITGNAVKLGGGGENLDPNDPKVKAALDLCSKKVNLNLGRPQ